LPGPALLRALNGIAPDVFFVAAREVADSFRPRRAALAREYRYLEPDPERSVAAWTRLAREFQGRIDARSFGRGLPAGAPTWRALESVRVLERDGRPLLAIVAPGFVWGMVRKIVSAFRLAEDGRLPLERLREAILGERRLSLPLAEPEPLVLWEVRFAEPWTVTHFRPTRHQLRYLVGQGAAARTRSWLLEQLPGAASDGEPGADGDGRSS
jgi:tRNA pseudouridine(38-40) synthase